MKKYFLGIIAIAVAISFSAFKAPFSTKTFLLTSDPISASIVSVPSSWTINGTVFDQCDQAPEEVACLIKFQTTSMGKFYHNDGTTDVLNTETYARANTASDARFLQITENFVNPRYDITSIVAKKLVEDLPNNPGTFLVVTDNTPNIVKSSTLGSNDVAYYNARH